MSPGSAGKTITKGEKNVGRKGREGGEREVMTRGGVKDEGFRRWVVRGQPRGEERKGKNRGRRNKRGEKYKRTVKVIYTGS